MKVVERKMGADGGCSAASSGDRRGGGGRLRRRLQGSGARVWFWGRRMERVNSERGRRVAADWRREKKMDQSSETRVREGLDGTGSGERDDSEH